MLQRWMKIKKVAIKNGSKNANKLILLKLKLNFTIRGRSMYSSNLVRMYGKMLQLQIIKKIQKNLLSNNILKDKQKMSQDFPSSFITKTKNYLIKPKS